MSTPPHPEIDSVNHALGVGQDRPYVPEHDPDTPREIHHTHEWEAGPEGRGWYVCRKCAARDHWPAASEPCGRPTNGRTKVRPHEARAAILAELDAFLAWWNDRPDTPDTLPDVHEWAANFWEWRLCKTSESESSD